MTRTKWTPERYETFVGLAKQGLTAKEIARELGVSHFSISTKAYKNRIKIQRHGPGRWDKIVATVKAKPWLTQRELAVECLCSKSLINFALKKRTGSSLKALRRQFLMKRARAA